jgi:hemin uptake protein HemP
MTTEDVGPAGATHATGARTKPEGTDPGDGTPRVVTSESLLAGASQLAILHDRTLYFLRQTRYGKLILTK